MDKLRAACESGDLVTVQKLLPQCADINEKEKFSRESVLHYAVKSASLQLVQLLVAEGADCSSRDRDGRSPVYLAALYGCADILNFFISQGAELNIVNNWGWSALTAAAVGGHGDCAALLLNKKVDVQCVDTAGWTALHWASAKGYSMIMEALVLAGADVEAKDSVGASALHRAVEFGCSDAVKCLLTRGANSECTTRQSWSPAHLGARYGQRDAVQLLLEQREGAVKDKAADGCRPLHEAAASGHMTVCRLLLEYSAQVDVADAAGVTPLQRAATNGHIECCGVLLEHGAKVAAADSSGWTALHRAAAGNHPGVMSVLIERGADVNVVTSDTGSSAAHVAASRRAVDALRVLLAHGADCELRNKSGQTVLALSESAEAAALLKAAGARVQALSKEDLQRLVQKKFLSGDDPNVTKLLAAASEGVASVRLMFSAADSAFCAKLLANTQREGLQRISIELAEWSRDLPALHAVLGSPRLVTAENAQRFMEAYHGFQLDEFKASVAPTSFTFKHTDSDHLALRVTLPGVPFSAALADRSSTDYRRLEQRVISEFHRCFRVPKYYMASFSAELSQAEGGGVAATCVLRKLEQLLLACGMGLSQPVASQSCCALPLAGAALGLALGVGIGLQQRCWFAGAGAGVVGALLLVGAAALYSRKRSGFALQWRFHNEALALAVETEDAPPLE